MKEDISMKPVAIPDKQCDMVELNRYLIERARQINEAIKAAREKYGERFNIGLYVGDILSLMVSPKWSLKDNLDNILSIAKGNTIAGIFLEHKELDNLNKSVAKDIKIDELGTLCSLLEKQKEEESHLKKMAFLFIVRNGLEDDFYKFNVNYHGNVDKDIQREFERIYGKRTRYN